ncbi:3-ketoacyl-ACP reductase [soil metagenome]
MPAPPPPTALVTGASRGLGRGIALELAGAGFSVAIHYGGNRAAAEESAALCRSLAGAEAQLFPLVGGDISDSSARDAVMRSTLDAFGGYLDALVNNAGIGTKSRGDLLDAAEDSFDTVLATNLKGPYFLSQSAGRHWIAHPGRARLPGGYKLVFISSVSATMPSPSRGDYCLSKAALAMANQLFSARLAPHGIQTIEFRPGIMLSDMTASVKDKYDALIAEGLVPQQRWGTPQDLGTAVRAFLTGQIPFTTGSHLYLDGGLHTKTL